MNVLRIYVAYWMKLFANKCHDRVPVGLNGSYYRWGISTQEPQNMVAEK